MDRATLRESGKLNKWFFAVIAAAVFFAILIMAKKPSGAKIFYGYGEDAIYIHHISSTSGWPRGIAMLAADGTVLGLPDTTNFDSAALSLDGTAAYLIDKDFVLFLINKNGYEKIGENVFYADISDTGDGIAYIVPQGNDWKGTLYLYSVGEKKNTKIASEVYLDRFVISPDGNSVAYADSAGCHRYIDGKEQGGAIQGAFPMAVSNNGKYFYYNKGDNIYAITNNSEPEEVGILEDRTYYLNRDYSQMLYSSDGKTYLCRKGKRETLSPEAGGSLILPEAVPVTKKYIPVSNVNYDVSIQVLRADNFSGMVCRIGRGLYYITKDMETDEISPSYQDALLSGDGDTLLYVRNGDLYRVRKLSSSTESEQVGHDLSVDGFVANASLSEIYYYNGDREIMYLTNEGSKKVYDGRFPASFGLYVEGDNLYFLGDFRTGKGSIFVSKGGDKPQKVSSSDQVGNFYRSNGTLYFTVDGEGGLFSIKKGQEQKILEIEYP